MAHEAQPLRVDVASLQQQVDAASNADRRADHRTAPSLGRLVPIGADGIDQQGDGSGLRQQHGVRELLKDSAGMHPEDRAGFDLALRRRDQYAVGPHGRRNREIQKCDAGAVENGDFIFVRI